MSNLLSQASLVMIPSGYKEDVVYSAVPTNGNGDLSFTRASNGTRVNSAGLVEDVAWNLVTYSEDFTNAGWVQSAVTITANSTTAPNGTTTAESFTSQATLANHVAYQLLSYTGGSYTYSLYVKKANSRYVYIKLVGDASQWVAAAFDLNDGTLTKSEATGWTGLTASSESVGNGWYRLIVSGSGATSVNFNVGVQYTNTGTPTFSAYADASFTGTGTIDYYIWGAQLNIGSTAKPYFPTTDRLNVPRLTYQNGGGGCPSLLLEKQSTNLNTYSNDISNASYTYQNASVSGTTTTSPDGTSNAYGIVADTATNTFHRWYKSAPIYLVGTYTTSIYAKKGTSKYFGIGWNTDGSTGNNNVVVYDLDAGTIASNPYSITASIESVGNGWYRCIHTFNFGTGGSFADLCVHNAGLLSNYTAAAFQVYDSPSVSTTLYVWGVQLEASSYPTSYIVSTSSSATRVADACFKTGISSLIGQTEGTMFVDVDLTHSNLTGANEYLMQLYQASGERVILYRTSSNELSCYYLQGATSFFKVTTITSNGRHKLAFAYKTGDSAFYIDGVQLDINTTTFSGFSNLNELQIGANFNPTQAEIGAYNYNQAILFKTRLTNAELASLTTI